MLRSGAFLTRCTLCALSALATCYIRAGPRAVAAITHGSPNICTKTPTSWHRFSGHVLHPCTDVSFSVPRCQAAWFPGPLLALEVPVKSGEAELLGSQGEPKTGLWIPALWLECKWDDLCMEAHGLQLCNTARCQDTQREKANYTKC